jgi:hypothetical protein
MAGRVIDGMAAGAIAAVTSGAPSAALALAGDGDLLAETAAAGRILLGRPGG